MTNTPRPGSQQWFGLAKETTYGVPVAAPTMWIPVDTPSWEPKKTPLVDNGLRGMMGTDYGQTQGMRHDELSYKTLIYADTVFPHLMAMLGGTDNVTALTATTLTLGTTSTTGGTLPAGATYWKVTATGGGGEGIGSNEVTATLTGASSTQALSWTLVTGASGYKIYRGTAPGAENVLVTTITSGATLTFTDTGTSTGAGTPPTTAGNVHAVSLNNTSDATHTGQPYSYTGFLYQFDGNVIQLPGMVMSDLKFTFKADTQVTLDVAWISMPGATLAAPTNTPSTLPPFPPAGAGISIAGVLTNNYSDFSLDLKRTVTPVGTLNGTNIPAAIFAGPLSVTGSLNALYQGLSDTDLNNLLNNTQPALSLSINQAGDSAHPLVLQCSKITYDSAKPTGSNTSFATIASAFKALMNATDALDGKLSPVQAKIVTTSATPY
ncbi:phage tail tube protein [Arthrobacter sp. efr-133-TYG-118]|uniref:phage tail tube protein n=1 Tax=Arthrobacter sp. efr-133-TYG-118 TaxID=3040279 RepID=UPI00254CF81E|nr:phage tail tube protein [Arthrobacter sp. efr-133-TYG-118]